MNLIQRDKKIIWHPFTQEKTAPKVIAINRAQGSYIYDENDKPYLDLISSWWVNLHGHGHPEIARSIYEQALQLEHVIFAGYTHAPAVTLCENLAEILPQSLGRFFFSDNGSTAVEVALKMAYQFWHNQGEKQRTTFLSFAGGYHGDTLGSMSVGSQSGFHDAFSGLLFEVLSVPYPSTYIGDSYIESKEAQALEALEQQLQSHAARIAAIIIEPLAQGASGMRICRASFIESAIKMVRKHGILVIFDEVMTGFGRTGSHFAFSQTAVIPDFLCLAKGLTGGFMPLALTITNDTIYQAFLSNAWESAFAHGHSYTANPIACAASIASLRLLRKPECQQSIADIQHAHQKGLAYLQSTTQVSCLRNLGTISAFTVENATTYKQAFLRAGLLLRPLGNTIYLIPPYSISANELENAYHKIAEILGKT